MKYYLPFLTMLCLGGSSLADPVVDCIPRTETVEQGEIVPVDIVLGDFPLTQGGGVDLRFNPRVLQVSGIQFSDSWNFAREGGVIDNDRGLVRDLVFASFPGLSGDMLAATISFRAIRKGKSRIAVRPSEKNPFASGGKRVTARFSRGKIHVISPGHKKEYAGRKKGRKGGGDHHARKRR